MSDLLRLWHDVVDNTPHDARVAYLQAPFPNVLDEKLMGRSSNALFGSLLSARRSRLGRSGRDCNRLRGDGEQSRGCECERSRTDSAVDGQIR